MKAERAALEQVEVVKGRVRDSPMWVAKGATNLVKSQIAKAQEEKRQLRIATAAQAAAQAAAEELAVAEQARVATQHARTKALMAKAEAVRIKQEVEIERAIATGRMEPPTLRQKMRRMARAKLAEFVKGK